jgi:hypothetical protein
MTVEELRVDLMRFINDELDMEAHLRGKRIVVENRIIILISNAKVAV